MTRDEKRKLDNLIEHNISKFLDENFWSKFPNGFIRQTEKKYQFQGIDVTLICKNNLSVHFDEKSKVYGCLNSVLQYPSFEISFVNRANQIQPGWFCQKNLSTDYYSFVGVYTYTGNENNNINCLSSENNISACDVLWVAKKDVIDYVKQTTNLSDLYNDAKDLRHQSKLNGVQKNRKRYENANFWLTYSGQLFEKPVNLVMPRNTLENFKNSRHFVVLKNEIKKLN